MVYPLKTAPFWKTKFLPLPLMIRLPAQISKQMNNLGKQGKEFIFLIDFEMKKSLVIQPEKAPNILWYQIPGYSNHPEQKSSNHLKFWNFKPVSFKKYQVGFDLIKKHINKGDTYLLNYTQPTLVETNLSLEEIYQLSYARYKILLKNKFVCFSPETFIKINEGKIYSFPMKGTIDAETEDAQDLILNDSKEMAEHNTIVDLIRNDLSQISENVKVDKFRYLDLIQTNQKNLWQVSSQISGQLPGFGRSGQRLRLRETSIVPGTGTASSRSNSGSDKR